jgi:hypothetical protein
MAVTFNVVESRAPTNKANCCDTTNKSAETLRKWVEQAKKNPAAFLEEQFKRPLEKFDRNDWYAVKTKALRFLPKKIASLITNTGRGPKSHSFYAQLRGDNQLSLNDSIKLIESIFRTKITNLTQAQKVNLNKNLDLLARISPDVVKKYDLVPKWSTPKKENRKLSLLDFLKTLPNDASPSTVDKALLATPKLGGFAKHDPELGRLTFPRNIWRQLQTVRDKLPECIRIRYAVELGYTKRKPGRKKVERIELRDNDNGQKRVVTITRKPEPKIKPTIVRKQEQFSPKPNPKLENEIANSPEFLKTELDVIKFINKQANNALLPDEFPRYSMYPIAQWGTSDWALVNVYRDRIYGDFLEKHKQKIHDALKRIGYTVGSNFKVMDKDLALSMISLYRSFSEVNSA